MKKGFFFLLLGMLMISCQTNDNADVRISGELKQWHKVTLELQGPNTSEYALENPFLDYKLEATFSQGDNAFTVPGYYAADGDAAESSAREGSTWKVHFRPETTGEWHYSISFKNGKNIAILNGEQEGEVVDPDGATGSFMIDASDKAEPDFRASGRLVNGGKGYLKFQGSEQLWIKSGADSPENFLAYKDFDQTYRFSMKRGFREGEANPDKNVHAYEAHLEDWNEGDPGWQDGKGKEMIGAINYLHSSGMNSIYMLTMNIQGDGKDVWPYSDYSERTRFDCSKLDQWEIVFDYMESLGMMAHFVLQETENEVLLDNGYTEIQRRVYLRELAARFGHHLGLTWNLGEENGPTNWSPIGQTDQQKKDMANYLRGLMPWPSFIVLHTHSNDEHQEKYLQPMLGTGTIDGPSMQISNPYKMHKRMLRFVQASEESGERWVVNLDEIGPHWMGVMPDSHDANHDTVRHQCLWGSLMAGGAGVEWYFGYKYPHNDLNLEDFRSRELWWAQSSLATNFFSTLPLEEMSNRDELLSDKNAYLLAKEGELYLAYLPAGSSSVKLKADFNETMKLQWFNPRTGGALQVGSITELAGKGPHPLGTPPSDPEKDWAVIIGL